MKVHLVRLDEVFFLVIYCSLGVFDNFKEGAQCYPIPWTFLAINLYIRSVKTRKLGIANNPSYSFGTICVKMTVSEYQQNIWYVLPLNRLTFSTAVNQQFLDQRAYRHILRGNIIIITQRWTWYVSWWPLLELLSWYHIMLFKSL